jgi:capsular polysaccharide biosynthesis protein
MGNQEILLTRPDTLNIRENIDSPEEYIKVLQNTIYTPTEESLENFMSLNSLDATKNIVNLASGIDSRILDIENDYVTEADANKIANKKALIYGG